MNKYEKYLFDNTLDARYAPGQVLRPEELRAFFEWRQHNYPEFEESIEQLMIRCRGTIRRIDDRWRTIHIGWS